MAFSTFWKSNSSVFSNMFQRIAHSPFLEEYLGLFWQIKFITAVAFSLSVFEFSKNNEECQNVAASKLDCGLQGFQNNLTKPIRYSESCVDSLQGICHQILPMRSSSGAKSSLKVEFFQKGLQKYELWDLP